MRIRLGLAGGVIAISLLAACTGVTPDAAAGTPLPGPFIPPTIAVPRTNSTTPGPNSTPAPAGAEQSAQPSKPVPTQACDNNLSFLSDLTIPDGTVVPASATLDKRWQVENSGTCNWDAGYTLKMVSGDPLGVSEEQALYPARKGSQATLSIQFTAPKDPGVYRSAWQAVAPDGQTFGDTVFIQIEVK